MDSKEIVLLLTEIRDTHREHLAEYRRVTQELMDISRRSAERQEQFARLYKGVLAVLSLVIIAAALLIASLLGAFS